MLGLRLGDEAMAMPAALVREIVAPPRLTRVPHAPPALLGMGAIRGEIMPVLSLASLLGRPQSTVERVIVADLDGLVGLAVSAVSHMLEGKEAQKLAALDIAALIARAMPERRARRATGAAIPAPSRQQAQAESLALITFSLGSQAFALPLAATLDVLPMPGDITRMPLADTATLGSIGWRGRVLPLLRLAALLGLEAAHLPRDARVIVVRIGGHHLGLVVDAMRSVERVAEVDIDPVPPLLSRGAEARIQAICRLDGGQRLLSVLATDNLVSQEITAGLLQGDSGESQSMSPHSGEATETFLMFRIGQDDYGLPIEAVQQVTMLPEQLAPLPRAPDFVRGVMQVRGDIIPVIDQSRRFTGKPGTSDKPRVLVVRTGDLTAGFLVDEVRTVTRLPTLALREAPDLGAQGMRLFDRVASAQGEDALVLIVSPQELLDRAEREMLAQLGREAGAGPALS